MPRKLGISMRWWLALAFAAIAALTAFAVAEVFNRRAEQALRSQARDLAIGQSVSAAQVVSKALRRDKLGDSVDVMADRRQLSLWVFGPDGLPLSSPVSRHVDFTSVPGGTALVRTILARGRVVKTSADGKTFIVGIPLRDRRGAVITLTHRPDLLTQLGIVHDQILRAAVLAVPIAALVGLLVATLIAARLRRIARTAATIEAGAFDVTLRPRFHDELGALAETIDQMRIRLRASFGELEGERDRLKQLLEGLWEGVVAVDRSLQIEFANRAAKSFFRDSQFGEGEPLPEPWPDFHLRRFARELFDGQRARHARIVAGDRIYALSGIPAPEGTADAMLVLSDISERERRERAEREFVSNAAHELGTPLTAIQTSLEVLQSGAKHDELERDRFLDLIERQTARLLRLRRALLALARAQTRHETPRLQPVLLSALLGEVAAAIEAPSGKVAVRTDVPDGLEALAHPDLLEQVVYNVVENALAHAHARNIELAGCELGSGLVSIEIRDDGTGIAGDRERVFDRFYRADDAADGFGLGLAIVREAIRAIGGTIEIDSRLGAGCTVRVTLAAAKVPVS
jgi:signal transduction histidine kinase